MILDQLDTTTLVEAACALIRRDILAGSFEPGDKLRVKDLRDRYGIGSSPIREALSRLVPDGLVSSVGQRGFFVAPASVADARDITNTRKLLESAALRDALKNGDDEWEARVVSAFHRLSRVHDALEKNTPPLPDRQTIDTWEQRNREFHNALVSACTSNRVLRFRSLVYDQAERYRRFAVSDAPSSREVHEEHRAMMEAALARDPDALCELADRHAERTFRIAVAELE